MFAIIETGGKQYRVAKGDVLEIEKVDHKAGSTFEITNVLLTSEGGTTKVGTPLVKGTSVTAKVVDHQKADKIIVYKKKPKKRYEKTQGHRQNYTVIEITHIGAGTAKAEPKAETKEVEKAETEKPVAKKAPAKKPATKKEA